MKLPLLLVVPAIALTFVALVGAGPQQGGSSCCGNMPAKQHESHHPDKAVPAKQLKDKQTAKILINGGYSPAAIEVKQGKPVELTFTGGKNVGCGGTVVFKSLKISKDVESGKSVVVKFTPKEKGEVPFTCGMGMLKGKVIVK